MLLADAFRLEKFIVVDLGVLYEPISLILQVVFLHHFELPVIQVEQTLNFWVSFRMQWRSLLA